MTLFWLALACAPDLRDYDGDGIPDVANGETADTSDTSDTSDTYTGPQDRITSTDQGDGVTHVLVDATNGGEWAYFGFWSAVEIAPTDDWSLAFARYHVMSNGGASGDGGVEVAVLEGQDFDTLTEAPAEGWTTDTAKDLAMDAWFDYDAKTHYVTAGDRTLVVHDGDYWKLRFLEYYDDYGNGGYIQFKWATVAPPPT